MPTPETSEDIAGLMLHRRDGYFAVTAEDPVLATMLHEHGVLSQRENNILGGTIALAGVAAVIVGAVLLNVPDLCSRTLNGAECLPDRRQWEYLFVPLPLLTLFGIIMFLSFLSNVNSQVLHKVERALWSKVDFSLPAEQDRGELYDVPVPSTSTLASLLVSPRAARSTRLYRLGVLAMVTTVAAVLLMPVLAVMSRLQTRWQVLALTLYFPVFATLFAAFLRANLPRRRALRDATAAAVELGVFAPQSSPDAMTFSYSSSQEPPGATEERRLWSYLLFPRRNELVLKSLATLLGLVVVQAALYGWGSVLRQSSISSGLLLLFVFEFLLYQGRYMLNDARDKSVDVINPLAAQRGRIPGHDTSVLILVVLVAVVRIACWLLISLSIGGNTGHALLWFGLGVVVLWPVYDSLSEFVRKYVRASTGPGGAERPPEWKRPFDVPLWPVAARLPLVAPGYALRGLVGASVAYGTSLPGGAVIWLGLALAAAEAANVTLGWILEGSSDVHARERLYREQIMRAPHVVWLTRRAGLLGDHDGDYQPGDIRGEHKKHGIRAEDRRYEKILLNRKAISGPQVWNVCGAVSIAASAPAGVIIAAKLSTPRSSTMLEAAALGIAAGALLLMPWLGSDRLQRIIEFIALPATLVVAAGNVVVAHNAGLPSPLWAASIPLLVGGLYVMTRLSSYSDYQEIPTKVGHATRRLGTTLLSFLFGHAFIERLSHRSR
jgi:hypothetical protein